MHVFSSNEMSYAIKSLIKLISHIARRKSEREMPQKGVYTCTTCTYQFFFFFKFWHETFYEFFQKEIAKEGARNRYAC